LDRVIQSNSAWSVGILYSRGIELKHGALAPPLPRKPGPSKCYPHMPCTTKLIIKRGRQVVCKCKSCR
jgi:hypothetical protein